MIESILLDILLILVLMLLAAIGAFRGGLREAFSAAGVVLGALLAVEWAERWGDWLADNTTIAEGGARFVVAVVLLVLATLLAGYGVGASFNYHPGPGGRMFGAGLGVAGGLVGIAYVMTWLRVYVFDGETPEVVGNTWVARFLDGDQGLVLLVLAIAMVVVAIFGSIVRERDDDAPDASSSPSFGTFRPRSRTSDVPDKVEPQDTSRHPSAPVRVQQSRQWEDRSGEMPPSTDRQWANTWPSDAPGIPQEERPTRASDVQRARERRKTHGQDGSGNGSGRQ